MAIVYIPYTERLPGDLAVAGSMTLDTPLPDPPCGWSRFNDFAWHRITDFSDLTAGWNTEIAIYVFRDA